MAAEKPDDEWAQKVVADFNAKLKADVEAVRKLLREEENRCCVCLESFAAGQEVHVLNPCRHILHTACSNMLFYGGPEVRDDCPYCRRRITISEYELDDDDVSVAPPAPESPPKNAPAPPPPPQ